MIDYFEHVPSHFPTIMSLFAHYNPIIFPEYIVSPMFLNDNYLCHEKELKDRDDILIDSPPLYLLDSCIMFIINRVVLSYVRKNSI
jgi:hypothetical protein